MHIIKCLRVEEESLDISTLKDGDISCLEKQVSDHALRQPPVQQKRIPYKAYLPIGLLYQTCFVGMVVSAIEYVFL